MKFKFTVFTPTFNRADLIHRVFNSLLKQDFYDFEWLIIDDGSTDNTKILVDSFKEKSSFKINYIKTHNAGKASAINTALDVANGFFFLVLDSDDWCDKNALSVFWGIWSKLDSSEKHTYSGISCLKRYGNGEIVGDDYTRMDYKGESYIDRFNKNIKGDKWELIKTEIYKENKYLLHSNERYMAPEYSWIKIAAKHQTVYLNESLSIIEYQEDGISKNNIKNRVSSPNNTREVYRYYMTISTNYFLKNKCLINFNRFSLHANKNLVMSLQGIFLFPLSFLLFLYDKLKVY